MLQNRPEFLAKGERARLFPVLADTSKEGRATSIFMACLANVDEFAERLLGSVGRKIGTRSRIRTYTEVCFQKEAEEMRGRPDGLIEVKTGKQLWYALVEAKIGSAELSEEQISSYVKIAKANDLDTIITISNQFAATPSDHPVKLRQRGSNPVAIFHWSWMHLLTEADLLLTNDEVADADQRIILNEFRRFLSHDSTGVKGFDRMPSSWPDICREVRTTQRVSAGMNGLDEVISGWHQEVRDLCLILSRQLGVSVTTKLQRKLAADPIERVKVDREALKQTLGLSTTLDIPEAAAPLEIQASLVARTISVSMKLKAPEDRQGSAARLNWLLRQIKIESADSVFVRVHWPRRDFEQYSLNELRQSVKEAASVHESNVPHSLEVVISKELGGRFAQVTNFISELEALVPEFYRDVGSLLRAWSPPAPKIVDDRIVADDVTTESIAEDAEEAVSKFD